MFKNHADIIGFAIISQKRDHVGIATFGLQTELPYWFQKIPISIFDNI